MNIEKLDRDHFLIKRDEKGRFVKGNNSAWGFKTSNSLKGRKLSEEHKKNIGIAERGEKHHNWKGGKSFEHGYIRILEPNHPHADCHGYIAKHILVAEKALGRFLKTGRSSSCETVHHINGNKIDNRPQNLLICIQTFHRHLHAKMMQLYMKEHFGG